MIIAGVLNVFSEQGVGPCFCIQDINYMYYDKDDTLSKEQWGYEGIILLEDGDNLRIYDDKNKLIWHGYIKLNTPATTQSDMYIQDGVEENKWFKFFTKEYNAVLERKQK